MSSSTTPKKTGLIASTVVPLVAGTGGGILLNDVWEGALTGGKPLPGYGMVLFPISTGGAVGTANVNFGVDDAIQAGIGVALAIFGGSMESSFIKNLGIGLTLGWAATKAGEFMKSVPATDAQGTYYHNPISIIPHRYPTVTATAGAFDMGTILPSNVNPSNYPVSAYYFNVA